ncbi:predicted protein [Streptomyces viridosporus ATCC 14672]|uniref:Predicted protein n=1 Tax=Streptomyces viridosporus (strain ATCC 14672 / DSM 40746 / JCM 4963 / KCTC 9882 / NRRL B-12104 / FH 1290) TaxID=566461 RepID=D6A4H0_STRV1|nr:predicted protein [Streptomyces viridosporus ATCC 14672]
MIDQRGANSLVETAGRVRTARPFVVLEKTLEQAPEGRCTSFHLRLSYVVTHMGERSAYSVEWEGRHLGLLTCGSGELGISKSTR